MGKKRISVESVRRNLDTTQATVVVWEKQKVEGETQEVPVGEKSIQFSNNLPDKEIITLIAQAARDIVAIATEAKTMRERLNKALEKEIVE